MVTLQEYTYYRGLTLGTISRDALLPSTVPTLDR